MLGVNPTHPILYVCLFLFFQNCYYFFHKNVSMQNSLYCNFVCLYMKPIPQALGIYISVDLAH